MKQYGPAKTIVGCGEDRKNRGIGTPPHFPGFPVFAERLVRFNDRSKETAEAAGGGGTGQRVDGEQTVADRVEIAGAAAVSISGRSEKPQPEGIVGRSLRSALAGN